MEAHQSNTKKIEIFMKALPLDIVHIIELVNRLELIRKINFLTNSRIRFPHLFETTNRYKSLLKIVNNKTSRYVPS